MWTITVTSSISIDVLGNNVRNGRLSIMRKHALGIKCNTLRIGINAYLSAAKIMHQ